MPHSGLILILPLIAAPATNPGLIVFLPLVGAILGGIVGAWAHSWYRDREAKKAEDRERMGLMSLIHAEVDVNDSFLDLAEDPKVPPGYGWPDDALASSLETSVWDQSQTRLAQLLPTGEVMAILNYYAALKMTRDDLMSGEFDGSPGRKRMKKPTISWVRSRGDTVGDIAAKYIDDPRFLRSIYRQQDEGTEKSKPDVSAPLHPRDGQRDEIAFDADGKSLGVSTQGPLLSSARRVGSGVL